MPDTFLTVHNLAIAYGAVTIIAGAVALLVVWMAMIAQCGLVRGGTLGWIPAALVALLVALGWPVLVVGVFLWREPLPRIDVRHGAA